MPKRDLPRAIRRAVERRLRRGVAALKRGDIRKAARVGVRIKHQVRLMRDGELILEIGEDEK